jgi:predicted nucleotidyltransferase
MAIDLSVDQLNCVKSILIRVIPGKTVWAFGSRVKGNSKKFSDLDLVIHSNQVLETCILFELKEAFSDSDLPFKIDIVEWVVYHRHLESLLKKNMSLFCN